MIGNGIVDYENTYKGKKVKGTIKGKKVKE